VERFQALVRPMLSHDRMPLTLLKIGLPPPCMHWRATGRPVTDAGDATPAGTLGQTTFKKPMALQVLGAEDACSHF
jgi:hypothetical protein